MFTGIIEELGKVLAIEKQPDAIRLTIGCDKVLSDLGRGDSISCSGTCLTAIEIDGKGFTADVMLETLKRSSLDGRTAASDGSSKWISGEQSRSDGHLRRSEVDAILVGTGTVLADDPELTARTADGGYFEHQPLRVILGESEIPKTLAIHNDKAETLHLRTRNIREALAELFSRGVKHLWVEGGPNVASNFVKEGLVDEFIIYLAPTLLGGPRVALEDIGVGSMAEAIDIEIVEQKLLDKDLFIRARRS